MSVWAVPVFLLLAAALVACDWRRRAVPRMVVIVGVALGWVIDTTVGPGEAVAGLVAGALIGLVADLPGGDVAVGGMLGVWLGVTGVLVTWTAALAAALCLWGLWGSRRIDWPGEWPFTPFLFLPACAVLIGKGIG